MQLGVALFGEGASGRSSHVGDLAFSLGTFCVPCDCSLHPSEHVIERLCKGMAASGCVVTLHMFVLRIYNLSVCVYTRLVNAYIYAYIHAHIRTHLDVEHTCTCTYIPRYLDTYIINTYTHT